MAQTAVECSRCPTRDDFLLTEEPTLFAEERRE